jgi:hypothetical protein
MISRLFDHISVTTLAMLLFLNAASLAHLRPLDIAVISIYFGIVIWIGFYLKGRSTTQPLRENDLYFLALTLEQQ